MSVGSNQRTKDGFPSAAPDPCTLHPDPKACFFSGPHASTAQAVLNLSSSYIYVLPLHLSPMWQRSTHMAFPKKITWQELFPPDHPNYWIALYFCAFVQKREKQNKTKQGKEGKFQGCLSWTLAIYSLGLCSSLAFLMQGARGPISQKGYPLIPER